MRTHYDNSCLSTVLRFSVRHLATLKQLMTSTSVDALSACLRYGNHANVVELLAQDHGVFWSQLMCLCSLLDKVIASADQGRNWPTSSHRRHPCFAVYLMPLPTLSLSMIGHSVSTSNCRILSLRLASCHVSFFPHSFEIFQIAASGGLVIVVNASQYSYEALSSS